MTAKLLGIIMSIVCAVLFFGVLIYVSSVKLVLIAVGLTALIVGAVFICIYLLTKDSKR